MAEATVTQGLIAFTKYTPHSKSSGTPVERKPAHVDNKTKAVNSAQWAIRPSSAITGLGERAGHDLKSYAANDNHAMRRHSLQLPRTVAVQCTAACKTRDIWPQNMLQRPPRFCVACRGAHEPGLEHNPRWQPYTPLQRFENLNMLETNFQKAFRHGELPLVLQGGQQPLKWTGVTAEGKALKPQYLTQHQYKQLLPLLFEGVREGHEPYRIIATYAALELLALAGHSKTGASTRSCSRNGKAQEPPPAWSQWLLAVLPEIVTAVKAGLNTMQPSLAANMLLTFQRLLDANNNVGPALVVHYKELLPAMALLMKHSRRDRLGNRRRLLLPPPRCVPPVGSFTGDGLPPAGSPACCHVCGAAFTDHPVAIVHKSHQQQLQQQEEVAGRPLSAPCTAPMFGGEAPEVHCRSVGCALTPRRATLATVVDETLQKMVEAGGNMGLAVVKRYIPTFDYYNPKE